MPTVTDHLLRTLAAIPPRSRVLDVCYETGAHVEALARLGFEVHTVAATDAGAQAARQALAATAEADAVARRARVQTPAALDYPDAHFDWVVAVRPFGQAARADVLRALRRVLKPGGWAYVADAAEALPEDALAALAAEADLAEAQAPQRLDASDGPPLVQAIYRRVEADTPV